MMMAIIGGEGGQAINQVRICHYCPPLKDLLTVCLHRSTVMYINMDIFVCFKFMGFMNLRIQQF